MLFLHGKKDPITPQAAVVSFRRWMKWKNNRIELVEFEGADHRFFNFTTSHIYHDLSIKAIERFLSELALYNIQKETFQNG
jgi:alpha-beta hydrolase superfamily lysophospholipase